MAKAELKTVYKEVEVIKVETVQEKSYVLTLSEEEAKALRIVVSDLFVRGQGKEVEALRGIREALIHQRLTLPIGPTLVSGCLTFQAQAF